MFQIFDQLCNPKPVKKGVYTKKTCVGFLLKEDMPMV